MRRVLPALLLLLAAGCRDTADVLSRDYRNLNNEALDALMMIDGEPRAEMMIARVLKPYNQRIRSVNDRVKTWKQNAEKTDYGAQLFTSDSVIILKLECEMNKDRLAAELVRLKTLADHLVAEEQKTNPDADLRQSFPSLASIVASAELTDPLKGELDRGTDVIAVLGEVCTDEKLLKDARMLKLKEAHDKKLEEFTKTRMLKIKVS